MIDNMPNIECWILVDQHGPTTSQDEFGIGVINGFNYDFITDAWGDIFESVQAMLGGMKIPNGAVSAVCTVTNLLHQPGQITFPETGQWDFPPYWEMDIQLKSFEFIQDGSDG